MTVMFAAAQAAPTPDGLLASVFGLFVLFAGAKVGDEIARRLGQPAVVGELIGGFVVGPHALALVIPDETAHVMAELGVVVLLFTVGLEVRVDALLSVAREALSVGVIGLVLPLAVAAALAAATGATPGAAIFVGLALAATSIGVTSRLLRDAGVLQEAFSRVIVGAAVVDDILALIAIGVVSGLVAGNLSASTIVVAAAAVGFVVLGLAVARRARGIRRERFTWPLFADTPLVPTVLLMLAGALLAASIGLAAIIGAFVVGLIVAETEARDELEHEMRPLALIFTPFFFAVTGAELDLGPLLQPDIAVLAVLLAVTGIAAKLAGGVIGAWRLGRLPAVAVGLGMAPRGEVGIVVANLALATGVLTGELFAAVLVAVVLTTVAAPLMLSPVLRRLATS
jgi:Kef-type K+ transport system membrane component KefB